MLKILKWAVIGVIGIIVLALIVNANTSPEQKAANLAAREQEQTKESEEKIKNAQQEIAALPTFNAADLVNNYSENTVAADQIFKGKKFKVTGTVASISTDFMGAPYLTLHGGVNQFMEPQFSFDKSDSSQLAKLKKNSKVTLACIGKGDVAKTPMSGSCQLL